MRTLHLGLRVADLAIAQVHTSLGYELVGNEPETEFGRLTMLRLPGGEFGTLELVHQHGGGVVAPGGLNHIVIKVDSLTDVVADLAARGARVEPPGSPDGSGGFWTAWATDPDGYRIELIQWPVVHLTA